MNSARWITTALILVGLAVLLAAGWLWPRRWESAAASATSLPVADEALILIQPRADAVYPPNLPAPTFRWQGGTGPFTVTVTAASAPTAGAGATAGAAATAAGTTTVTCDQTSWQPAAVVWKNFNQPLAGAVHVTVRSARGATASATFSTSSDPVIGSLLFREVILPFAEAVRDPSRLAWRFGPATASAPPPVVLTGLPVCGNCHSFSNDGKTLGMDVDYANDKGSYALVPTRREMILDRAHLLSWTSYRPEDQRMTFGLLAKVSPDGQLVVATVKDRSVFVAMDDLAYSQRFFPVQGILAVYDRATKKISALPGADDPTLVQSNGVWSPDGQWIYFCRAPAVELTGLRHPESAMLTRDEADRFFAEHPGYGYGIWRLPWNQGRGGTPQPVTGAVIPNRSCYFPRLTPDGRFMVFCQARQHMLLQPDSELWIVPAAGGTARRMRCNGPGMNSWHSFSPDGKWMVFSSKAAGPYTQLMLTHIDAEGNDTPAIPLERLVAPERAANIPEFANLPADAIVAIQEAFMDGVNHLRAGTDRFNAGDQAGAERHFRAGLALDPKESRLHFCLGSILAGQNRLDEAVTSFRAAVGLDPGRAVYHASLAEALLGLGKKDDALAAARTAHALAVTAREKEIQAWAEELLSRGK